MAVFHREVGGAEITVVLIREALSGLSMRATVPQAQLPYLNRRCIIGAHDETASVHLPSKRRQFEMVPHVSAFTYVLRHIRFLKADEEWPASA